MPAETQPPTLIDAPEGWDCAALDQLVDPSRGITYGIVQPGQHDAEGVPIVRVNNLKGGRIDTTEVLYVSKEIESKYQRTRLRGGEILLSLVGTLGECALVPGELRGWNVARAIAVIPLQPGIDPRWVTYCLRSIQVQALMNAWATTTVQATLNLRDVRGLPILLAPEQLRAAITDAVSSLDDKTEQNRRTSAALERLARAMFRAWFVDFEPVKAKSAGAAAFPSMPQPVFDALPTRLVDSELGPVPEGWEVGQLGDVAKERREAVDPSDIEQTTPYIGLEHMPRRSIALTQWEYAGKVTSGKARFRAGQILFGKLRPYFHKVGIAPIDGVCSTDIVVIEPKTPDWFGLTLAHCSSDAFVAHTNACSTGTKMPRTSWRDMAQYPVTLPPVPIAAAFNEKVSAMANLIVSSIFESRKLAQLRDYLLPKLLSGNVRLEVNDA